MKEYMKIMRAVSGAHPKTSAIALLVRLGVLPLRYQLCLPALCEVFKIVMKPVPGAENLMQRLRQSHGGPEASAIIGPAMRAIDFFQSFCNDSLINAANAKIFRKRLIAAMYSAATQYWQSLQIADATRLAHPRWESQHPTATRQNKIVEHWYIASGFTHNRTRSFSTKTNATLSCLCRACGNSNETVTHIYMRCEKFAEQRRRMRKAMNEDFSMRNIIGNYEHKNTTEKFIRDSKIHEIFT